MIRFEANMSRLTGLLVFFCLMLLTSFMQTVYSIAAQTACPENNSDRYEQRGEISSPNYPKEYPANSQCKWHIYHDPGEVVTISFQVFDVEQTDGAECTSDVLRIEEKVSSIRLYCGNERQVPYISDPTSGSKDIVIKFESDEQVSGTGFLLEYYKSQQDLDSCPDAEQEFLCQNRKCIPKGWLCNDMDECGDRSDEAVDVCQSAPSVSPVTGGVPSCPSHTIYCLKNDGITSQCLPEDKKCDGNKDCYNDEDELGCQVTCVHEMPPPSGSFSSPNYPGDYQNNLDCSWTLVVNEGNIIQLRFVAFDIEQGYHRDYVTVYDGGSISADIINTYYGYKSSSPGTSTHYPPAVIEGSSNRLYVTFITDGNSANSGFNATYQSKGDCIDNQRICSATDSNCYAENEHCDGTMTCLKGEDEQGCSGCPDGEIPCSSDEPGKCYNSAERCNGQPHCSGKEDELDCPALLCSGELGLFLCGMGKCIKENWICDSNVDCPDNTDEMDCPMSPKVITAAVVGSIVCGLLLVAALSCTCKLYQLYHSDPHPPTHTSPLSEIEDELMRREAPPSYTASMSSPHFDEAQRAFIESLQAAAQARGRDGNNRSSRTSRRRNNSQPDRGEAPQQNANRPSSPDSVNTTQDTISTTDSTTNGRETSQQNPPSSEAADDSSSPYTEITELRETPNLGGDTASSCTTDTDSDTNAEAELEQRDHEIIRAATNIRRMRLAGGIQNIVDTVTNRQREGAGNGEGETRRRSSSGLQNIIQRVNRSRGNQRRGEGGNSGPNSPTDVSPPTLAGPDGTRTPPNTQESSFTSEDDHSPERDNAVNHHSTSSANGSDAVSTTTERNKSSGASEQTPNSNSPQPPPSPSPSSRSDDAPLDLSNSNALNDEDSTIVDDDETMLLAS